jgi:hypothetical protein
VKYFKMSQYMHAKNQRERRKRRREQEDDAVPRKLPMTGAERMRKYRARRGISHRDEDTQIILQPGLSGNEEADHRTTQHQPPLGMDIVSLPDIPSVPAGVEPSVEHQPLLPSVNAG